MALTLDERVRKAITHVDQQVCLVEDPLAASAVYLIRCYQTRLDLTVVL